MPIKLKIGDKVILKKDRTKAVITLIIGDKKVKILDNDQFEYIVNLSEVIPIDKSTDTSKAYGTSFDIKDENNKIIINKKSSGNRKKNQGKVKIDLHIEQFTSHYHHMKNYEIVKMQMDYCQKELDIAINKHKASLEIIHGVGGGVLKSEVHRLLNLYNLKFFESNNGGSTEVIL